MKMNILPTKGNLRNTELKMTDYLANVNGIKLSENLNKFINQC